MSAPEKTAVLGAEGFIGRQLLGAVRQSHPSAVGTSRRPTSEDCAFLDFVDPDVGVLGLRESGHSVAVICAAVANISQCERSPEDARRVNVDGTLRVTKALLSSDIVPVFLSSDYVFGRDGGPLHGESEPLAPCTEYGRQKAEVEAFYSNLGDSALVIRLGKVYGQRRGDGTMLDEMAASLVANQPVLAATDQLVCPILVQDVARAILSAIGRQARGVLHLAGPQHYSRYDLACAVARELGLKADCITGISLDDMFTNPLRPKGTLRRSSATNDETLGFSLTPVGTTISRLATEYFDEEATRE